MVSTGGGGASGGCLPFQSMQGGRCTPAFAGAFLPAGSPRDLAMAPDGSFYVVGLIEKATDFDPGSAVDMQAPAGVTDAFVTHFAADGSYLWTRTIGGATAHVGQTVAAVDAAGVLFLAGDYTGPVDLDPGPGTNLPPDGPRHSGGFVAKWDASGAFVAAVCFPGDPAGGIVQVNGLAMGARGEVQMAGVRGASTSTGRQVARRCSSRKAHRTGAARSSDWPIRPHSKR